MLNRPVNCKAVYSKFLLIAKKILAQMCKSCIYLQILAIKVENVSLYNSSLLHAYLFSFSF